ncbi:MAG TPA: dTDP-4-dehydrorhamnose 3,5-epimerase [Planctomycetota bacterium]|nr:dTDP-4-dehydrorhamnose 3,5-epimerase [Planctomycetota bacterium]
MKAVPTSLPEVLILEPKVFEDERGHFYESWRLDVFRTLGIDIPFVQDNHSHSKRHVLRGMHFQLGKPQAKLVRVLQGEVFDVAVDVRRGSPRFGQWAGERLSAENRKQLFVPEGFAHGFLVLSPTAEVLYKVSDFWSRQDERGIAWNDPMIGIRWPLDGHTPLLNPRDAVFPSLGAMPDKDLPHFTR